MKNLEKAMESQMLILIVVIECSTLLEYILFYNHIDRVADIISRLYIIRIENTI